LLQGLKRNKNLTAGRSNAKIVVMAQSTEDAKRLYKGGADYVILPHLMGGRHLANIIKADNLDTIDEIKKKDLNYLQ